MQLEMLKQEFKDIHSKDNPLLTKLVMWCLENEYESRPDFFDLEGHINKIESDLIQDKFSKLESPQNEEEIYFKRSQQEMKNLIIDNNNQMNFAFSTSFASHQNKPKSNEELIKNNPQENFQTFSEKNKEQDIPEIKEETDIKEDKQSQIKSIKEQHESLEDQKNINNILSVVEDPFDHSQFEPFPVKSDFTKKSMKKKKSYQKIFDETEKIEDNSNIKSKSEMINAKKMKQKESKFRIFDDSSRSIRQVPK